jgi:hypothetical protein
MNRAARKALLEAAQHAHLQWLQHAPLAARQFHVRRGQKLSRPRRRGARRRGAIRDAVVRELRAVDERESLATTSQEVPSRPRREAKRLVKVFRRLKPPLLHVRQGSVFTVRFISGERHPVLVESVHPGHVHLLRFVFGHQASFAVSFQTFERARPMPVNAPCSSPARGCADAARLLPRGCAGVAARPPRRVARRPAPGRLRAPQVAFQRRLLPDASLPGAPRPIPVPPRAAPGGVSARASGALDAPHAPAACGARAPAGEPSPAAPSPGSAEAPAAGRA